MPDAASCASADSQRQYWFWKSKYKDVILFIKIGTFYELYEDDAQIGVDVLNFKMTMWALLAASVAEQNFGYMGQAGRDRMFCGCRTGVGHCRQVGCPQSGIDDACQRLLAAGYKVGRIEQTETAVEAKAKRGPKVRSWLTPCTPL